MVASLRRVIALMGKEFLALLKDKKGRFVLIGPPIIQLMVFGYAASFDLNHVPYAIYNEDGGSASRQLWPGSRVRHPSMPRPSYTTMRRSNR